MKRGDFATPFLPDRPYLEEPAFYARQERCGFLFLSPPSFPQPELDSRCRLEVGARCPLFLFPSGALFFFLAPVIIECFVSSPTVDLFFLPRFSSYGPLRVLSPPSAPSTRTVAVFLSFPPPRLVLFSPSKRGLIFVLAHHLQRSPFFFPISLLFPTASTAQAVGPKLLVTLSRGTT